ncbi:hypothetical protein CASFOL_027537 [Castilleja foliolosa]|uniref:SAUR family protein n=1 Tax=Castilleja foliolosa TaxID=1961234 RepID=A0ABD3CF45_9LAMI
MAQEKKKSSISLKPLIKRLQNHLPMSRKTTNKSRGYEFEELVTNGPGRNDVKEGYFAIVAKNEDDDELATRFVVELCVLKHPDFLRLLKMAEEEYGFRQRGALAVPCQPEELKRILMDKSWRSNGARDISLVC